MSVIHPRWRFVGGRGRSAVGEPCISSSLGTSVLSIFNGHRTTYPRWATAAHSSSSQNIGTDERTDHHFAHRRSHWGLLSADPRSCRPAACPLLRCFLDRAVAETAEGTARQLRTRRDL